MLDIFGNVFGRSKKPSNSTSSLSSPNSATNADNNESNDGFIVLGQTHSEQQSIIMTANEEPPPLYPTTILTNDMLRMGASAHTSITQSSSTSTNVSIRFPYHREGSYSSPIDNVPFSSTYNTATDSVNTNLEINKCFATIERIQQYLSTPSQSEYNFHLENSILSESLLS